MWTILKPTFSKKNKTSEKYFSCCCVHVFYISSTSKEQTETPEDRERESLSVYWAWWNFQRFKWAENEKRHRDDVNLFPPPVTVSQSKPDSIRQPLPWRRMMWGLRWSKSHDLLQQTIRTGLKSVENTSVKWVRERMCVNTGHTRCNINTH